VRNYWLMTVPEGVVQDDAIAAIAAASVGDAATLIRLLDGPDGACSRAVAVWGWSVQCVCAVFLCACGFDSRGVRCLFSLVPPSYVVFV